MNLAKIDPMETSTYKVYFDAEMNCVTMEWDGYSTSAEFRQGTELMLNTLISHKANYVLADIKNMVLIGSEDQKWVETQFIPRAISFGFAALAIVRPNSYFNKVAIESISYKVDKEKLAIGIFDNLNEAKLWLKSLANDRYNAAKASDN